MWKKSDFPENIDKNPGNSVLPISTPPPIDIAPKSVTPVERAATADKAIIGPSISVKGEISGAEDILIQGTVDGTLNLKQNIVTVGKSGRVSANVYGRIIHVEGEVTGDCFGTEQVVVHKSGTVKGNITAPRVSLEDGARLKGTIDTSSVPDTAAEGKFEAKQTSKRDANGSTSVAQ